MLFRRDLTTGRDRGQRLLRGSGVAVRARGLLRPSRLATAWRAPQDGEGGRTRGWEDGEGEGLAIGGFRAPSLSGRAAGPSFQDTSHRHPEVLREAKPRRTQGVLFTAALRQDAPEDSASQRLGRSGAGPRVIASFEARHVVASTSGWRG